MKLLFFSFIFLISFITHANLAIISKIEGKVLINVKTTAKVGDSLNEFDIIEAIGKKSLVDLKFKSGHLIRLRSGKTVIKKMNNNETVFKLIKGKIFSFVNSLGKKQKFKVETKHASLGVRGTMFMTSVDENKSYLCVCEGSVESTSLSKKTMVRVGEDQFFDGVENQGSKKANSLMMTMATDEFKSMGLEL